MRGANRVDYYTLQLKQLLVVICFFLFSNYLANAAMANPAVGIAVNLTGDDALSQELSFALRKKITADKRFILLKIIDNPEFIVTSASNVNYDVLAGKGVVIFHVKLQKKGGIIGDTIGICYKSELNKCANNILNRFSPIILIQYRVR